MPKFIREYYHDEDNQIYETEDEDYTDDEKEKELMREFTGFVFYVNSYDSSFEGFGMEIDLNVDNSKEKEKVEKLFAKYKLGKPTFEKFSHWW